MGASLKTKQMANVIEASKSIFNEAKPEIICSDAGSEFKSRPFQKLANDLGIQLPSPQQTTTGWQ